MHYNTMNNERLYEIESAYYSAGLVFDVETRKCTEAAPILGWMVGRDFDYIKSYCKKKSLSFRKVERRYGK